MIKSTSLLKPLLYGSVAVVVSHAPINDSYRESLLIRQMNKGKDGSYYSGKKQSQVAVSTSSEGGSTAILSAQDMLMELKDGGLPIATIAAITGVERKTVYSWLDGSSLKASNEERIVQIYSVLNENKTASYRSLYRHINRNIDGNTLASSLSAIPLDVNATRNVLAKVWPLAERSERNLALNSSKAAKGNPVLDESTEAYIS